jgi:eukaryotic-like serine/threonine-protein kinase
VLKARQKLGKYRIEKRLAEGGFAAVYRAHDTIEGIPVALKIPHNHVIANDGLKDIRREVRLTAGLDHPNILPVKDANFIDELFVIVCPLGEKTLADRLHHRLSAKIAVHYADQMLAGLAHAHKNRIIHCDVKPDNLILFPDGRLRLADFGIAKISQRTCVIDASGTGTIGYLAPEQALGRPSFSSDVFSIGLVLYRMFAGELPQWPYEWPMPGIKRLRRTLHADFVDLIKRALLVDERKRFKDAQQMRNAFLRIKPRALKSSPKKRSRSTVTPEKSWKTVRLKEFRKRFGKPLQLSWGCERCGGPVAESMHNCPWCGTERRTYKGPTKFPDRCNRCGRGTKLDWAFCPWCYGKKIGPKAEREYSDVRYTNRCQNDGCTRRQLMPFMRYCPWCNRKVRRKWRIPETPDKCGRCGCGVVSGYWDYCPWCGRRLATD